MRDARCLLRKERTGPRGVARRRGRDAAARARRGARRLRTSGVNPSDVKSRAGLTRKIAFPRVIPHSDGAGEIEAVGEGVSPARVGERVWVWNGQWRRAFGTAAQSIVLPAAQAVPLPANDLLRPAPVSAFPPIPPIRRWCSRARAKARRCSSRPAPARSATTPSSSPRNGGDRHHHRQLAREGRARAGRRRRPHDRLQARGCRRAGHGDHRQARRRRRDRDGSRRQCEAPAGVLTPNGVVAVYGGSAAEPAIPFQFLLQNSITLKFFLVYLMPHDLRSRATAEITRMLERASSSTTWRRPSRSPTSSRRTKRSRAARQWAISWCGPHRAG